MNKKTIKVIQVFLNGHDSSELSDELVSLKFRNGCAWVTFREDGDGSEHITIFPLTNVSFIRLIDEEIE
jgi:hypothetical protein